MDGWLIKNIVILIPTDGNYFLDLDLSKVLIYRKNSNKKL